MKLAVSCCAAAVLLSGPAAADEIALKFGTLDAPNTHLNARALHPWAARVNAGGAGTVRIDLYDGGTLVQRNNVYDRTMTNVVQIAYSTHSNVSGKFPRSNVVTLPFLAPNAEIASIAYWRLYSSGALDAEYDQAQPLFIAGYPMTSLHFTGPLKSLDDLRGLKVITANKALAESVTRLGGAPVTLNAGESYQAIQRRTVDGIAIQWMAFEPFKLGEVTKYHVEAPLGSSSGMVFMAKPRYQALPAAARAVIDAQSGEGQSRTFGRFWDQVQAEGRATVSASSDHTIVALSPAQAEAWRQRLAPIADQWAAETPDGRKILDAYRALIATAQSEKRS
jgi:TRAP-type C4-dicarboxylate transport system substrate-binding protein